MSLRNPQGDSPSLVAWPDGLVSMREGEVLPIEPLSAYLIKHKLCDSSWIEARQFPSGHSNLTYLIQSASQRWVLRRPPNGVLVKSAHDMSREVRVLAPLSQVYPPAPRPLHFCDDLGVLGVPFYLMEYRAGLILRGHFDGPKAAPDQMAKRCIALIEQLVALHAIPIDSEPLASLGKPSGYVARQVAGWKSRFLQAQYEPLRHLDWVANWLEANLPPENQGTIVHNDFKFDNVVFDAEDPTRIVAVLDWEMATLGDPWMDLGTTLGYWLEAGEESLLGDSIAGPTSRPGALTRRELVSIYQQRSGRVCDHWEYYWVFGLFKIAVIVLQIYVRYRSGATHDPRFSKLDQQVNALGLRAWEIARSL